ncbi:MAG: uracil-DNA glycosylase [Planctomycetes bacterium]|nr:uracil-DNA glycosylase [Planctomycetota bacterium]
MVQPSPPTGASATPDDASQQPTAVRPASGRPAAAPPHAKAESITGDEERAARLRVMDHDHVRDCQKCSLAQTRTNTVFGQGSASARLVFVGEAPGFDEDRQGLAFVGRAGKLLTRMIQAMNLTREEVFICNVLKCRPPDNRDPAPDEVSACSPYLMQQLEIIRPEVIVALGAPAARTLLRTTDGIGRLRGRFHDFYIDGPLGGDPTPLMPTYHPAYLLRSPQQKAKSWADLQQVMVRLGLEQ